MSFPIFLSLVCVVRNQSPELIDITTDLSVRLSSVVNNYELIMVDNASTDDSVSRFIEMTSETGLPNLQVYTLTKEVDKDTAAWVGVENALGDYVVVFDPQVDDLSVLPELLEQARKGVDAVFAKNLRKPRQRLIYRLASTVFDFLYAQFAGIHLVNEAPRYRILSKRIVNFILQHPQPALAYRHLPATGGFSRATLEYRGRRVVAPRICLRESIDRGIRLLVTTTRGPMRLVTSLSLFGAIANLVYSAYVLLIGVFKEDVAPGWVSLSLQQSGMFFLISLVLLVLGEYILGMTSFSCSGPAYHVTHEFTSARQTRKEKLNIEDAEAVQPRVSLAFRNPCPSEEKPERATA